MAQHARHRADRRRLRSVWFGVTLASALMMVVFAAAAYSRVAKTEPSAAAVSTPAPPERPVESTQSPVVTPSPRKAVPLRVPASGTGQFQMAEGRSSRAGRSANLITYRVEVETGVPFSAADFARAVDATLGDPRGWTSSNRYSFQRSENARLRIILATPGTTDRLCAPLQTRGEVSCRNGNVVAINAVRWVKGATSYSHRLADYRIYVVNHEVGHSLGLAHASCPANGMKAPVMLQQTLGLQGCVANPWP